MLKKVLYIILWNLFIGTRTGESNIDGAQNTFVGRRTGVSNSSGGQNSFYGEQAGQGNTTGSDNSYFGKSAGSHGIAGTENAFFGSSAGLVSQGSANTFIGYSSGSGNGNGNDNTFIGNDSGNASMTTVNNSIAIGKLAEVNSDNQARIGDSNVDDIGGFAAWTNLSDGRFKIKVEESVKGLDFIQKLHPVTYQFDLPKLNVFLYGKEKADNLTINQDKSNTRFTGFIAQEVEAAARETGYYFSGVKTPKNEHDHYGLRYAEFVVPLVKGMQEQQEIIEKLEQENLEMREIYEELSGELASIKEVLGSILKIKE